MDSFEFNKIVGALLATVFIVFSVALVSDAIFAAPVPEKPGYHIEAQEEAVGGDAGPAAPESVLPMLASANVGNGETIHKKCVACHTVEKGGANKTGPNLWDIVNRPIATHEGFGYSGAIKEFSQGGSVKWDYDHLDHFLLAPKGFIKGTAMGFAGVKKTQERADLIAYLRTLSDNPAPLPDAAAAEQPKPANADGATPPADGAAKPAEGEKTAEPAPAEGTAPTTPAPVQDGATPAAPAENAPAQPAPAQ